VETAFVEWYLTSTGPRPILLSDGRIAPSASRGPTGVFPRISACVAQRAQNPPARRASSPRETFHQSRTDTGTRVSRTTWHVDSVDINLACWHFVRDTPAKPMLRVDPIGT